MAAQYPTVSRTSRLLRKIQGPPGKGSAFSYAGVPVASSAASSDGSISGIPTKSGGKEQIIVQEDGLSKFYVPIDTYEGRHRYDPTAQWSAEEEKKLVRRVSRTCVSIVPVAMLTFSSSTSKSARGRA